MKKVIPVLKVLLLEYVVSALLLLIVALCMYKAGLAQNVAKILVLGVYFIANFVGGLIIGKAQKNKRLIWGVIMGAAYLAVLLLVSVLTEGNVNGNNGVLAVSVCCILAGSIGGIMS